MKEQFFHGSAVSIEGPLRKASYVSRSRCNALIFAQRRREDVSYIYTLLLGPAVDVERHEEAGGLVDHKLARDTPFSERNLVTPQLIEECKESIPKGFS